MSGKMGGYMETLCSICSIFCKPKTALKNCLPSFLTVQPRMHETSARGWCTGMTQRDGMGKRVGGGFRMGNTCKSMAGSCQCTAKTTTIL